MRSTLELLEDMGTVVPIPPLAEGTTYRASLLELYGDTWVERDELANADIYDLLDEYRGMIADRGPNDRTPNAFVVVTTGWAAPLGPSGEVEGAPSAHPARRRVALFALAGADGGSASRMVFADDVASPVDDEGSASGSLADALDTCALALWGADFVRALVEALEGLGDDPSRDSLRARLLFRLARVRENVEGLRAMLDALRDEIEGGQE